MNRIRKKLESRRGASITFALLLFLVCAVVSGVVIVAATAAAGHMSSQSEMDQRYYAVAAATDLLRERLEKETVTVTVKDGASPTVTSEDGNVNSILESASLQLMNASTSRIQTLPVSDDDAIITCNITQEKAVENGLLKLKVSASGGRNNKSGSYTLELTFASNIHVTATPGVTEVSWKLSGIKKGTDTTSEAQETGGD